MQEFGEEEALKGAEDVRPGQNRLQPFSAHRALVARQEVGDGGGEFCVREALQITSLPVVSANKLVLNHVPRCEGRRAWLVLDPDNRTQFRGDLNVAP